MFQFISHCLTQAYNSFKFSNLGAGPLRCNWLMKRFICNIRDIILWSCIRHKFFFSGIESLWYINGWTFEKSDYVYMYISLWTNLCFIIWLMYTYQTLLTNKKSRTDPIDLPLQFVFSNPSLSGPYVFAFFKKWYLHNIYYAIIIHYCTICCSVIKWLQNTLLWI